MENTDFISRANAIIDDATQKAAKTVTKYSKPKYIAAILEMIVSAVAIMGIQIVAMGFNFSKLTEWQFWVRTLALTACIFLLYRAVVNARFEKTAERPNVISAKDKYNDLSKKKELDMKEFLDEFNLKTKISVYVSKINRRINKLERKKIRTFNLKKKTRLSAKIDILKKEISTERIQEVINYVRVKYYIVCYDDFEDVERLGGNGRISTRGQQDYNNLFNRSSVRKMWIYLLCSAILSISIWSFGDSSTIQIIANVLSSMVMIVTRIVSALVESDRIYDSTITAAYVCKSQILEQYFEWQKNKPKEVKQIKEAKEEIKPLLIENNSIIFNPEVA